MRQPKNHALTKTAFTPHYVAAQQEVARGANPSGWPRFVMGARVEASPPPSGAAPALVVATPAAERLRCPGGVARNARRSTVTEDQVPASFQLFDKEDVGGWRPAA